jgi:hypothetical protein
LAGWLASWLAAFRSFRLKGRSGDPLVLAWASRRGPTRGRRRTTRVVSRCLRMKEPGRPPPSHPPSAVRPLRGGRRARSLCCKPSEQRGYGEDDDEDDDDDDDDDDNNEEEEAEEEEEKDNDDDDEDGHSRREELANGATFSRRRRRGTQKTTRRPERGEKRSGARRARDRVGSGDACFKRVVSAIARTKIVSRE